MKKRYLIGGGLIALVALIMIAGGNDPAKKSAANSKEDTPALAVSAKDLSAAYQNNEARAQITYEGKQLQVSGLIKDIDLSLGDSPVIRLKGAGDQYGMGVNSAGKMTDVAINGLTKEQAAMLDKGTNHTFICDSVQEVLGSPQLRDCTSYKEGPSN